MVEYFWCCQETTTKVKVIVESLWWQQPNCQQGLKAEVHFHQKSKGRGEKGKNTHRASKIGFPWFSKSQTIETNWSRDDPRLKLSNNLRGSCRLQRRGTVHGRSESRQHVVARKRWLGAVRPRRREGKLGHSAVPSVATSAMFSEFTDVLRLSISIREIASEYPFCVFIYKNSYIFHIYFILVIFLSNTYEILNSHTLDVIIGQHTWILLLSPHGERVAKYTRTYLQRYTHKKQEQNI